MSSRTELIGNSYITGNYYKTGAIKSEDARDFGALLQAGSGREEQLRAAREQVKDAQAVRRQTRGTQSPEAEGKETEEKSEELSQTEDVAALKAEILRLKEFEDQQVEFQRIKNEFYEEVIYAENGPGIEEYIKYYEAMDPAMAEELYKQVVAQQEESKEIQDYAQAYSEMKPKAAAGIIEAMPNDLKLAARILNQMSAEDRGKILEAMDPEVAAKLTKIMDPES